MWGLGQGFHKSLSQDALAAKLNYAGTLRVRGGQNGAEVEIMAYDNQAAVACIGHHDFICRGRLSDR